MCNEDLPTLSKIKLKTTLPEGTLLLAAMNGTETVSAPFRYDLDLYSADASLESAGLLGEAMTVTLRTDTELGERHFHGVVTRFLLVEQVGELCRYRARLSPRLSVLGRTKDCRVFRKPLPWELASSTDELEGKTSIPDIVQHVLTEHGVDFDATGLSPDYPELEYVVQYQESDLDFVGRLLEDGGIYYYFRHEADRHVLVLVDSRAAHVKDKDCKELPYYPPGAHRSLDIEHVFDWSVARDFGPVAVSGADYQFEVPTQNLKSQAGKPGRQAEIYEYPAGLLDRDGAPARLAVRLEEIESRVEEHAGATNARGLLVGRRFELCEHPRESLNGEYFVTEARVRITGDVGRSVQRTRAEEIYTCSFAVIRDERQFRPARRARKPRIVGPQTAVVVGKDGEDFSLDEHGRIAVRFHWERYAATGQASSCLARVSQAWAGNGYGMWAIPRIGQEVVVEFLDGDPDRPIITGCVYNGDNRPPFDAKGAHFGIRSRSTKGAGADHCNEIRIDDRRGQEELFIQAQNLQTTRVKGSQTIGVDGARLVAVGGHQTTTVAGTRTTTVTKVDRQKFLDAQELTVAKDYTATYQQGRKVFVYTALDEETIDKGRTSTVYGDYKIESDKSFEVHRATNKLRMEEGKVTVKNLDSSVTLDNESVAVSAPSELRLECGSSSLVLKADGTIEIHGTRVVEVASAKVSLTGGDGNGAIELGAAGATMTGTKATVSSGGTTEITGLVVRIN